MEYIPWQENHWDDQVLQAGVSVHWLEHLSMKLSVLLLSIGPMFTKQSLNAFARVTGSEQRWPLNCRDDGGA